MADFPVAPSRWKWFTRLGAIIKGSLAHGWIVDDVPGPFDAGEADTMTLDTILQLRTTGGGAAFYQALMTMGAKFSPVYFTAAYHDPDELQLTGLPDVPDDVQWVGVIEWTTTGEHFWFQPAYHITYDAATDRIQLAGATFQAGSQFMAIYVTTQNAYDKVDGATPADRQRSVFDKILEVLELDFDFETKDQARHAMFTVADLFRNWNYAAMESDEFKKILSEIDSSIATKGRGTEQAEKAGASPAAQ